MTTPPAQPKKLLGWVGPLSQRLDFVNPIFHNLVLARYRLTRGCLRVRLSLNIVGGKGSNHVRTHQRDLASTYTEVREEVRNLEPSSGARRPDHRHRRRPRTCRRCRRGAVRRRRQPERYHVSHARRSGARGGQSAMQRRWPKRARQDRPSGGRHLFGAGRFDHDSGELRR